MRFVYILGISLLTIWHSSAQDICANQSFGYKAIDVQNPNAYFLCLGVLGKIRGTCDEGFRFNKQEQKCVVLSESSGSPKNVFNINQNINMNKPFIFNIFGPLWKRPSPTPPALPAPTTTEAPATNLPDSTTSTSLPDTDTTTENYSSSSTADSSTDSSSTPLPESSTESSSSATTESSTESISSSTTETSTESSTSTTELEKTTKCPPTTPSIRL